MYELYNDRIFDLLDEARFLSSSARQKPLAFRIPSSQSARGLKTRRKVVSGLRKVYAQTLDEALRVLELGQACRRAISINSDSVSSRSHAFLQLEIKRFSSDGAERGSASLNLVDLAGSECARNAQTAGDRLVEVGSINRSLMSLGQCLQLQTQRNEHGKPVAVPWRSSKLTELLFSNLFPGTSGSPKAVMIVTADAMGDFNATSQILKYAALAREITVPRPTSSRPMSGMRFSTSFSTVEGDMTSGDLEKDALIARLIAQVEETGARWRDAEERCLQIEQTVREELASEMDQRLDDLRKGMVETRLEEEAWREEYVDEKLEIMKKSMGIEGLLAPSQD